MTKQRILFITTGGTIASVHTPQGLRPVLSSDELLAHLPELNDLCIPETLALCSIDSTDLGQEHWLMMPVPFRRTTPCTMVSSSATAPIRWLFRSGTFLPHPERGQAHHLTGASSPSPTRSPTPRKPARQRDLMQLDPGSRGVMVVLAARHCRHPCQKNKTISYDAFASVNFPELALVQGDRLVRYIPSPWPTGPVEFGRA